MGLGGKRWPSDTSRIERIAKRLFWALKVQGLQSVSDRLKVVSLSA
jgi:hypothetical protein